MTTQSAVAQENPCCFLISVALLYARWHSMMAFMRTGIDRFGRVVVPQSIRKSLRLDAGTELEIEQTGDAIVLRPVHERPDLALENGILVFTGDVGDDQQALRSVRDERLRKLRGTG